MTRRDPETGRFVPEVPEVARRRSKGRASDGRSQTVVGLL